MLGEKQHKLASWWFEDSPDNGADGIIAEGAIRSGKTHAMIQGFLSWSQVNFSNQNFIVAGKSMGALKRNVVVPMMQVLSEWGFACSYNRSEGQIRLGSNTYHLFGANNDSSQDVLQGMTAAGAYADEVALFPKSFVDQMIARCSVEGSKLWFNCNPSYPTHFFKTDYVDRADELNLLHLQFLMDDNPTLSEAIKERYRRMFTGVFYDRYILGLWTLAEGLVYPDFRDAIEPQWKERLDEEGNPILAQRYVVSLDYGIQNATAALLWAYDEGVWHVVKEYHYSGRDEGHQKTDADYVADMQAFIKGYPDIAIIVDPSATSFIAALRRAGFKVMKARNDVLDGIRETAVCMQQGLVKISENCTETIKEFSGYVWDEKKGNDLPVKADDHHMDALRYGVATMNMYRVIEPYTSPFQRSKLR